MSILEKINKKLKENGSAHSNKFGQKYNYGIDPYAEDEFKAELGWEHLPKKKKKKVLEKIEEQFDYMIMNPQFEIVSDEKVFSEMANFLMGLEPDQLNDIQLQKMVNIFTEMQAEADVDEEVKAKRSRVNVKQYAGSYYRTNKKNIKKKKVELERSIKGITRNRMEPIMAKGRKSPTGRHKVSYNV
jgi:hypothetical protein